MSRLQRSSLRASVTSAQLTTLFKTPILVLAFTRHVTSAVYFATISVTYKSANQEDLRSVQAYAPGIVGTIMGLLSLMHVYGLAWTVRRVCCLQRRGAASPVGRFLNSIMSPTTQLTLFHTIDVVSQSYQAGRMSFFLVDRRYAMSFAMLVSAYCLVTPWFLFTKHTVARRSLVLLINNALGFVLNSAFPIALFIFQALRLVILDRHVQNDDKFVTVSLLIGRYIMVSSPADLFSKIASQCLSCVSIRSLVQSVTTKAPSARYPSRYSPPAAIVCGPPAALPLDSFSLQFRHRRHMLWYLIANLAWGITIVACAGAANFLRTPCPDYCMLATSPWLDLTCSCVHVELNCALRGIRGTTVDEYIRPRDIGTSLFTLNVRRCDLPHGVPIAALQPFQSLFAVFLYMTNITDWPLDPIGLTWPPSLTVLHIRGSNLQHIPQAFAVLPPNIVYLRVEGGHITSIPDAMFIAWANVSSLSLSNLQLAQIPSSIATFQELVSLELRGNELTNVPLIDPVTGTSPSLLTSVDLSANHFDHVPLDFVMLLPGVQFELSSNPIAALPPSLNPQLLTTRQLILDDTPFCNSAALSYCLPKCAKQCETQLLGDYRCDMVCYSGACNWDYGDCSSFGLSLDV
ncbi:hypothetical protein DYB38_009136 [Aphanomyces astaci]|uniref:LNR domain-containing protein n=1 Tax=Aphanomyces astaci TaxID=112090 RepID=A0A397E9N4_APHAT|nr:hypothetical protein DYB38_009136 [Aphanomyces astaci]